MVDVHIATPYGVSPSLSLPVSCTSGNCAPASQSKTQTPSIQVNPVQVAPAAQDPKTTGASQSESISAGVITIAYDPKTLSLSKVIGEIAIAMGSATAPPGKELKVSFPIPDASFAIVTTFKVGDAMVTSGTLTLANKKTFEIDPTHPLTSFATEFLKNLKIVNPSKVPALLTSSTIEWSEQVKPGGKPTTVTGAITVMLVPEVPPSPQPQVMGPSASGDMAFIFDVNPTTKQPALSYDPSSKIEISLGNTPVPNSPLLEVFFPSPKGNCTIMAAFPLKQDPNTKKWTIDNPKANCDAFAKAILQLDEKSTFTADEWSRLQSPSFIKSVKLQLADKDKKDAPHVPLEGTITLEFTRLCATPVPQIPSPLPQTMPGMNK